MHWNEYEELVEDLNEWLSADDGPWKGTWEQCEQAEIQAWPNQGVVAAWNTEGEQGNIRLFIAEDEDGVLWMLICSYYGDYRAEIPEPTLECAKRAFSELFDV